MNTFDRTLSYIGDLDDSFYDDERQRDVWNEASAVGFQSYLWVSVIAAVVLPWAAGEPGAWVSAGILVTYIVISNTTLIYAKRRDVDLRVAASYRRPRIVAFTALYLLGVIGVAFTLIPGIDLSHNGSRSGAVVGAVVGGLAGLAAGAWGIRRARLRNAELAAADEI